MMNLLLSKNPLVQGKVNHDEAGASRVSSTDHYPPGADRWRATGGIALVVGTARLEAYQAEDHPGLGPCAGASPTPCTGGTPEQITGAAARTARELCAVRDRQAREFEIVLADTAHSSPELGAELRVMGAGYAPLNLGPMAHRRVVGGRGGGRALRTILREPPTRLAALNGEWRDLEAAAGDRLKLVVINSVAADEVAVAAGRAARQHKALVVSVLTPSTSLECRIDSLLAGSGVALADVGEFRELAAGLGVACPAQEHFTVIPRIAGALRDVVGRTTIGGDVVVTAGECGQVIYDADSGVIFHLGLTASARSLCRNYLPAARLNGIGDTYAANLAAAWALLPTIGNGVVRTIHRAKSAWSGLLAGSSPRFLHPQDRWFEVQVLATGLRPQGQPAAGTPQPRP